MIAYSVKIGTWFTKTICNDSELPKVSYRRGNSASLQSRSLLAPPELGLSLSFTLFGFFLPFRNPTGSIQLHCGPGSLCVGMSHTPALPRPSPGLNGGREQRGAQRERGAQRGGGERLPGGCRYLSSRLPGQHRHPAARNLSSRSGLSLRLSARAPDERFVDMITRLGRGTEDVVAGSQRGPGKPRSRCLTSPREIGCLTCLIIRTPWH